MSLVYCPRTHAYFQHAPYPLAEALAAGVRVALGTDSRASNPDLDLLAEMRFVARAYPTIDPHDVLRMGTLAGAEALGREDEVGSLTPGKLANMVAVPLPEDVRGTPNDVLAAIFANDWPVSGLAAWAMSWRVPVRAEQGTEGCHLVGRQGRGRGCGRAVGLTLRALAAGEDRRRHF